MSTPRTPRDDLRDELDDARRTGRVARVVVPWGDGPREVDFLELEATRDIAIVETTDARGRKRTYQIPVGFPVIRRPDAGRRP